MACPARRDGGFLPFRLGSSVLMSVLYVGIAVGFGGGIDLRRDHHVDEDELRAASNFPGRTANPFAAVEPGELYVVPLDRPSQRHAPLVERAVEQAFGMRPTLTPGTALDPVLLDRGRGQVDAWRTLVRLFESHERARQGTPAIIVALTSLDTWNSSIPGDRFALLASGHFDGWRGCGGVISTARLHVWPGRAEARLAKLAGRLVARCLRIEQKVVVRSVKDVDELDERGGAGVATIAQRVAARRALPLAPAPSR
jgi:hypothetical protein